MDRLKIRKKTNWGITLYLLLVELVLLLLLSFLFYGLIEEPFQYCELWGIVVILVLAGMKLLDIIIWNFHGVEVINFKESCIIVEKQGRLFHVKKMIAYDTITGIEIEEPIKDLWINMLLRYELVNYGVIKITYKQGKYAYRIGQSLTLKEAESIIAQLKQQIPINVISDFQAVERKSFSVKKVNRFLRVVLFVCSFLTVLQIFLLLYYLVTGNEDLASFVFF